MRVGRAGDGAADGGQVESQVAGIFSAGQVVGPQALGVSVGFDAGDQLGAAAGEAQVSEGLLVDGKERGGGAEFGRHVGDRCPVGERQRAGAGAAEFEDGTDHALAAQILGQGQHEVGGLHAGLARTREFDADDLRQAHPDRPPEHHRFGLDAADAPAEHAEGVDHGGVAVGADQGVGEGEAVLGVDHRREFLKVDLVQDAVARHDHVHVVEGALRPGHEGEALGVAARFVGHVLGEGVGTSATDVDGQ